MLNVPHQLRQVQQVVLDEVNPFSLIKIDTKLLNSFKSFVDVANIDSRHFRNLLFLVSRIGYFRNLLFVQFKVGATQIIGEVN